jgi:hypothetical protein
MKYIRLNKERTELTGALMNVKPRNVKRHPDEELPLYDWFPVIEVKPALPDTELYRHERGSWKITDDGLKVEITYTVVPIGVESGRAIVTQRYNEERNHRLANGLVFNGHLIHTRPDTYKRVMGLVMKAMQGEFETDFITEDNQVIHLDRAAIFALGDAFVEFEGSHIFICRHMKDLAEANNKPEEIDITQGWPSNVFGVVA